MRILVVHPVMTLLGGGERLCCETIRALLSDGHEVTMLSETFDPERVEDFFGYPGLFRAVNLTLYPANSQVGELGTASHLIYHARGQGRTLRQLRGSRSPSFDLVFSTQDPGYLPDLALPTVQWGYFPRYFPKVSPGSSPRTIVWALRSLPLCWYYQHKVSRIGLVLAISQFSQANLDKEWRRPSILIYPACNMITPRAKSNLVVTVARASPIKRLELFWDIARLLPQYEFTMLLTRDPTNYEYSDKLSKEAPSNGRTIFNPPKEAYHRTLGEAKVYLHLMKGEHFGIAIVEAMSASCVPVVHDSGGPREIVGGSTGFLWEKTEDIPGMVDAAMQESPSDALRNRAWDFSSEKFGKKLSSILSRLPA